MQNETADEQDVRRPYTAPEVIDLGSVAELTQGGGSHPSDLATGSTP